MRRLAGRKADGWISGGLWMTDVPGELAHGNLSRAKTHSQPLAWHFALATLLCDIR